MEELQATQEKVETFTFATEPNENHGTQTVDLMEIKMEPIKIEPHSYIFETKHIDQKLNLSKEAQMFRNDNKYMLDSLLNDFPEDFPFAQKGSEIKVEAIEENSGNKQIEDLAQTIKNEELNMKDEETTNDKGQSIFSMLGEEQQHKKSAAKTSKNIKRWIYFICHQCEYMATNRRHLELHLKQHKKPEEIIECESLQEYLQLNIKRQSTKREEDMFKCSQCSYETDRKGYLNRHQLNHTLSPDEVNLFKCEQCDYQTHNKINIDNHCLKHKSPDTVKFYKCNQCGYQTIYEGYWVKHCLQHKSAEEVNLYKCDHCDFQTLYKRSLHFHSLKHKNPDEIDFYKCTHCDYQSARKDNLSRHIILKHKNPDKVGVHKCDQCDYQSDHKGSLNRHLLKHKNLGYYKCDQCNYETDKKEHLRSHLLRHINPDRFNFIKCDHCDYQTFRKGSLNRHLLKHKNSD